MIPSTYHDFNCAILATARNVLWAGLEEKLRENVRRKRSETSSLDLFRMCHFSLVKRWDLVADGISHLMERACCGRSPTTVGDAVFPRLQAETIKPGEPCAESRGSNGRQLVASGGIGPGTVCLRERPLVACAASSCQCRENGLLVEHLKMAWELAFNRGSGVSLDRFLTTLQSGITTNVLQVDEDGPGASTDRYVPKEDHQWSFSALCLMLAVSIISTRYTLLRNDEGSPNEEALKQSAWQYFEILSRIPTNVHAVTCLASRQIFNPHTDAMERTVEQERVGYAMFMQASAVNHSCDPNCLVRFQAAAPSDAGSSTELVRLACVELELVATRSVGINSELTISYGPLAGVHPFDVRRKVLAEQYLFECQCAACEKDVLLSESRREQRIPASATSPNLRLAICNALEDLRCDVTVLGVETTELMNSLTEAITVNSSKHAIQRMQQELTTFECEKVVPVYDRLRRMKDQLLTCPRGTDSSNEFLHAECSGLYCNVLDIYAHSLAKRGEFRRASELVNEMIELMVSSGTYLFDDVVVARERVKLAGLLMSCGQHQACRKCANLAVEHLSRLVSFDDADLREAVNIRNFVTR